MAGAGKTILFATHYLEEADMAADRIVIISHGRRVADGSASQIKDSMGERRIRFTLEGEYTELLRRLAGVSRMERFGQRITLFSRDADATVRDLAARDLQWRELEVESVDLEEAFLSLTGAAR